MIPNNPLLVDEARAALNRQKIQEMRDKERRAYNKGDDLGYLGLCDLPMERPGAQINYNISVSDTLNMTRYKYQR